MTEPTEAKAKEPTQKLLLLFAGYTVNEKGERSARYYRATREEFAAGKFSYAITFGNDDRTMIFGLGKNQKKFMLGSVGMVYEVDATMDGGSIFPHTAKFIGRWSDTAFTMQLQAQSETALASAEAAKAREKDTKFNEVKDALEPVRAAYQALPMFHRQFFLAQMVDYLNRRGSPK